MLKIFIPFFISMLTFLSSGNINEEIKIQKGNTVKVRSLDIKVEANEFVANTFMRVELYNSGNELMDGTWEFSLEDGQVINGFSLDINGKQRQGVVVEKNKGRIAYETVVNRKIDPGLLENIGGNNYRVRVYPVAAKSSRIITINIAEQMRPVNNEVLYFLPLVFDEPIENFSLNINVSNDKGAPIVRDGLISALSFNNKKLEIERKQFGVSQPISFAIPLAGSTVNECIDENGNFSIYFPYKFDKEQKGDHHTSIFWDVSSSSRERHIEKELSFLENYIWKENPASVELILFSNEVHLKQIFFSGRESIKEIKKLIRDYPVDGATNMEVLSDRKNISEINILFSDGLNNFGNDPVINKLMHTVSSSSKNNNALLRNISKTSGGHFVDLNRMEIGDAIKLLDQEPLQDLRFETSGTQYAFASYENGYLSVTGKMNENEAKIKLKLPGGEDKQFNLNLSNTCATGVEAAMLSAGYLHYSSERIDSNNLFKKFASENSMVSSFSSLIVLDNLNDYISFNIMPPPDLIDEYNKKFSVKSRRDINDVIKDEKRINDEDFKEEIIETLADIFNYKTSWWKTVYNPKPRVKLNDVMKVVDTSPVITYVHSTPAVSPLRTGDSATLNYSIVLQPVETKMEEIVVVGYGSTRRTTFTGAESSTSSNMHSLSGYSPGIRVDRVAPGTSGDMKIGVDNLIEEQVGDDKGLTESDADAISDFKEKGNSRLGQFRQVIENRFKGKPKEAFYKIYLDLKQSYGTHQEFYITTSNIFHTKGLLNEAARILSNLCEMELEDPALLRAMAYISESRKDFRSAVFLYSKVLSLRSDELHSYRDLALAHQSNGDTEKAIELVQKMLLKRSNAEDDLDGLKEIALTDLDHISGRNRKMIEDESLRSIFSLPISADLRVIIDWNKDQTDIDLHVKEPSGEVCNYQNKITKAGGRYSDDATDGFGPEEFMIRKAVKGKYEISINYYGDNFQREDVPAIVKLTIIKFFGTSREQREIKTIMLNNNSKTAVIGTVSF